MKKSIVLVACLLLIPSFFSAVAAEEPEDFKFEIVSGIGLITRYWNYREPDNVVVQFDMNFKYYRFFTNEKIGEGNETIRTKICWQYRSFILHPKTPFEIIIIHCEAFGDWDDQPNGGEVHIWEYKVLMISQFSIVLDGGYVGPK